MNDLKHVLRRSLKNPGFTALAVSALALGIGLVSAQISFIKGVMLASLPFEEGDQVMLLRRTNPRQSLQRPTPVRDYLAWREQQQSFEDLAAYLEQSVNFHAPGQSPQRYRAAAFTSGVLPVLRIQPIRGRGLLPADDAPGAAPVVLLSHRVWQRDFQGDPEVINQAVQIDGRPATVVGVLPEDFAFPLWQEIWSNFSLEKLQEERGPYARVEVIGRLRDGVSPAAAHNEFRVIAARLAESFEENREFTDVRIASFTRAMSDADTGPVLISMLVMVVGVLLIACTNVATLMLARAVRHTREMAIRAALGASRARLIAQTLMESTLLSLAGGVGGLLLGQWGVGALNALTAQSSTPFWWDLSLDLRVVLGTAGIALVAGVLCGFFPAWQASRPNFNEALKETNAAAGGLRLGRLSRSLVYVQVVLTGALLIVTVLMAKSVVSSQRLQLPFSTANLLMARIDLSGPSYDAAADRIAFYSRLVQDLEALPGVESATVSSRDPVGLGFWLPLEAVDGKEGTGGAQLGAAVEVLQPGYFPTLGLSLIQGRDFAKTDTPTSEEVAIVNESFARRHWPDEAPLGRRLRFANATNWVTVIGVAPDLPMQGVLRKGDNSGVYLAHSQKGWGGLFVLMRVRGEPRSWETALQKAVWALAPNQPVHTIQSLETALANQWTGPRMFTKIFSVFGLLAVVLAMLGIYGVMAFAVAQRTREFGLRFALGAQPAEVRRMVLGGALRYLAIGLPVAFLLAFGLGRPFEAVLIDVSVLDPVAYGIVAVALGLVVLLAAWGPASRAARVDPAVTLRGE